ncbi:hypothetical protein II582_02965 [bacterium]|nr:hypothetical protein [bacterium]
MIEPTNKNTEQEKKKESKYTLLQLKPFKDNELGVNHWDTVLTNCASLGSKKISFIIY